MVKATRKPLEQIFEMVKGYKRVLVIGCGGCTSVCLAGGQREAIALADELSTCARSAQVPQQHDYATVERQCNPEFLEEIEGRVANADCLLSMACGAGAGLMADAFPAIPTFPALDTMFVGVDRDVGLYEERCRSCGTCMLGDTGGICPVTRCLKASSTAPAAAPARTVRASLPTGSIAPGTTSTTA